MSRSNRESHTGSNQRSNAGGMSALDYITMASGQSRRGANLLHPSRAHASPPRAGLHLPEGTICPSDSISNVSARSSHAPRHHHHGGGGGGHSLPPLWHSPSAAPRNSQRAPSVSGPSAGGSRAGSHVPQSVIRDVASGAGSSSAASQALARYNNERSVGSRDVASRATPHAGTNTAVTRATFSGGIRGGQSATAGTIATERTITVTETENLRGRKTVVKIYKAGEIIEE